MRSALHTLTLFLLTLGLSACVTPRYQSAYRYEAPTDVASRACLEKCASKMTECRGQCASIYQICLNKLEQPLEERNTTALKRYESELDHYHQEMAQYVLYSSLNWGPAHPWHLGMWLYSPWNMPYYFPPVAPAKPSRDAEFERLRHERCDMDCGCQPIYDTCFLTCGGKIIPEVKCISNCPP